MAKEEPLLENVKVLSQGLAENQSCAPQRDFPMVDMRWMKGD